MLDTVLVFLSIWWFYNTKYFEAWSKVKIGGDQLSISIIALVILIYLVVGLYGAVKWYYPRKSY